MAGLIRTFLETACIPKFQPSMYHSLLFRYHVLDDYSFPNPGYPPFYSAEFFSIIRKVHRDSPLNVKHLSEKQWYRLLVEENVTMENLSGMTWDFIPSRMELKSPSTVWEESWRLARLKGLGPENTTFLFRLLHCTLPTQERLARTSPNITPLCKFPGCPGTEEESLAHALVHCQGNNGAGAALLSGIQSLAPGLQPEEALRLELEVDENTELPLVFALAVAWSTIWDLRQKKTRPQTYLVRAQLEARVTLLREGRRYRNEAGVVDAIIETL